MNRLNRKRISILFLSALCFSGCQAHGALCKEHTWMDWAVFEAPTCSKGGREAKECKVCGFREYRDLDKDSNAHSWIDNVEDDKVATCTEDGVTGSKVCEYCGTKKPGETIEKTGHNFGEWNVTKEATTLEKGTKERKCLTCNYVETEEIDMLVSPTDTYPTENYYDGYYVPIVSWENSEDLKNQLHTLIRTNFTGLVYEGNWETNQMAEQSLVDFNKVNVIYSQKDDKKINTYGGAAAGSAGWQREHAFCASLMTSYLTGEAVDTANNGTSRATDFHNLFAAFGAANGGRGNKNFGNYDPANGASQTVVTDADTKADTKNYEPNDCDKGRLARAIFYMGVMYNEDEESTIKVKYNYKNSSNNSASKTVNINAKYKPVKIVENYVDFSQYTFTEFVSSTSTNIQNIRDEYLASYREDTSAYISTSPDTAILADFAKGYADYKYNEFDYSIGNLSTLISWNDKPVDRAEMWHNEVVYSYVHQNEGANKGKKQGNRNPFVDYPELVDYVYGSKKDKAGRLENLRPSEDLLETNSNELYNYALSSYKNKYLVGETLSNADYTIVRVNKDFTTQNADFTDTNQTYTFVESDIGEKAITLTTPTGDITYTVKVESAGGANACNYKFDISKDSFISTSVPASPNVTKLLSYGGVDYNFSATTACSVGKSGDHASIGNGTTAQPGTLTIQTVNDFSYNDMTNVSSIYVGLHSASGKSYTLNIYVGSDKVYTGSVTYNKGDFVFYGADFENKTGPLKIEVTGANAAIHMSGIYVKVN